jgi:NADH-quinone oxidoreductase subunit J
VKSLAEQAAFAALALMTLGAALQVVRARNVIHAGFWLLPAFLGISGLFATLEAHFFFIVQVMVYAGAILVIILFALQLTRDVASPQTASHNRFRLAAIGLCGALFVALAWVATQASAPAAASAPAGMAAQTKQLGIALIGAYVVPFEVASLILLAALVGAIVVARNETEHEPPLVPLSDLNDLSDESDWSGAATKEVH